MERVTGIEPAQPAWKAGTLPLSYTRAAGRNLVSAGQGCNRVLPSPRASARDQNRLGRRTTPTAVLPKRCDENIAPALFANWHRSSPQDHALVLWAARRNALRHQKEVPSLHRPMSHLAWSGSRPDRIIGADMLAKTMSWTGCRQPRARKTAPRQGLQYRIVLVTDGMTDPITADGLVQAGRQGNAEGDITSFGSFVTQPYEKMRRMAFSPVITVG